MKINFKIIAISTAFMLLALFTWGMRNKLFYYKTVQKKNVTTVRSITKREIVYDIGLLNKLKQVSQAFSTKKQAYCYWGVIDVVNGADTSSSVKNLAFLFCRNGNDTYSKTGASETLNADGIYLYIEHDHKRIIISSQKKAVDQPLVDMSKVADNLRSERYELFGKKSGKEETISIINEHHISCKEYSVTFDTTNNQVNHIHMRLTNFNFPLNKQKEKIVDARISSTMQLPDIHHYLSPDKILTKTDKGWQLTAQFSEYELIKLP